jgi:hypothetical protein
MNFQMKYELATYNVVMMSQKKSLVHNEKPLFTYGLGGCTAVVVISSNNDYATMYHCDPCVYPLKNVVINEGDIVYVKTPGNWCKVEGKYKMLVAQEAIKDQIAMWRQAGKIKIHTYSTMHSAGEVNTLSKKMLLQSIKGEFIVYW